MTTFVIDLKNISKDTKALATMLKDMDEKEVKQKGRIVNFRLENIIEEIENFYESFKTRIFNHIEEDQSYWLAEEDGSFGGYTDIYGNLYDNLGENYNYAEITYNYITRFEKIRLLGVDKSGFKIRFMVTNVSNNFSQTTMNLIKNIKDITKPVNYLDEFLSYNPARKNKWGNDWEYVKKGFKDEPKNKYSWEQLSNLFFVPKPIYKTDEITDEQIRLLQQQMEENGPFTKQQLDQFLISAQENKQAIADKADKKKEKSKTIGDKQRELKELSQKSWTQWVDKYSVGLLIQEAIKCVVPKNISFKQLLENLPPGQLYERIKGVFPQGDSLLSELDAVITDTIIGNKTVELQKQIKDLQQWIKEDELLLSRNNIISIERNNLENVIQQKKDSIDKLKVDLEKEISSKQEAFAIQKEQFDEYMEKGDIGVILKAIEGPNALSVTNAIISSIELVIPIEDLYQRIVDLLSGNGLPKFDLPDLRKPATDPLSGFTFEISEAFVLAVMQAILSFLDGILSELINSDNLDSLIANAVGQSRGEGNTRNNPLQDLFTPDSNFFSEGGLLDRNYDRVIEDLSKKAPNILEATIGNKKIPIGITGEQFTQIFNPTGSVTTLDNLKNIAQTITSSFETAGISSSNAVNLFSHKIKEAESMWEIDSTGTKFEIQKDAKIINLAELDKYLASIERERAESLQQAGDITLRALSDASGVSLLPPPQIEREVDGSNQIVLTDNEKRQIKQELSNSFKSLIAVMPPSQLLSLLSGNSTEQTKKLATEIIKISDNPNLKLFLPNDNSLVNVIESVGKYAGLDQLEDQIRLLSQSPSFRKNLQNQRCGTFNNVSDFRKSLLARVVDPQQAKQIIDELENQRIKKFNDMVQQLLDMTQGNVPNPILDSNSALIEAVKSAKNGLDVKSAINNPINKRGSNSVSNRIRAMTNSNISGLSQANNQQLTGSSNIAEQMKIMKKNIESSNPVLKQMFEIVVESLFDPIESSFYSDVRTIPDAYSEIEEVDEIVERTIVVARNVSGSIVEEEVINPKFSKLIDSGLVPVILYKNGKMSPKEQPYASMVDKSSLQYDESQVLKKENKTPGEKQLGYVISGDISKKYTKNKDDNANLPAIKNKTNKKIIGSSVTRSFQNYIFVDNISQDKLSFSISGNLGQISDSFLEQMQISEDIKKILDNSRPSWKLSFDEVKINNNYVNEIFLETSGVIVSNRGKRENFFSPSLLYSGNSAISENVKNLLIRKYDDSSYKKRKDVFDDIVVKELRRIIDNNNNMKEIFYRDFRRNSLQFYKDFIENFIASLSLNLSSPRLLNLATSIQGNTEITELQLLDFIKCDESQQLITILNFKKVRDEFRKIYEDMPDIGPLTINQIRSFEKRETKISKTSKMIVSSLYIKMICLDFIVKALPVFDYFKFSKNIVEGFITEVITEYVAFELRKKSTENLDLVEYCNNYVKQLYNYKNLERISQERIRDNQSTLSVEVKEIIKIHIQELLEECKDITNNRVQNEVAGADEFILFLLENYKTINIDNTSFTKLNKKDGIVLQKFAYIPSINRDSVYYKNNEQLFRTIDGRIGNKVMGLDEARQKLSQIKNELESRNINVKDIFVCHGTPDGNKNMFFSSPIQFGLRIVVFNEKAEKDDNFLILNNRRYDYGREATMNKLGNIVETEKAFDVYLLAQERIKINKNILFSDLDTLFAESTYDNEFYNILRTNLALDEEVQLLFSYSLPLKEIFYMFLIHYFFSNNGEKMRALFEPSKKTAIQMLRFADLIGDSTKSAEMIKEINKEQRDEEENVGNPAGPLNLEALKLFYRTPIQILKSLAVISDPNISLTDKVIRTMNTLMPLLPPESRPPFIPYSLVSIALAPFPIFQPPPVGIGFLTTYNITSPIGPLFLFLEPLLWDLPYYQVENRKSSPSSNLCGDTLFAQTIE